MKTIVVGATGATGQLLVDQLLNRHREVKIIVRSPEKLPVRLRDHDLLEIVHESLPELRDAELIKHVKDCDAVASCLGHTVSWKGIFGPPYKLVAAATRRLCNAIKVNGRENLTRFVLMNTAGNSNRDLEEGLSFNHKAVISLFRLLLPPHRDNEKAADYLRVNIGQRDPCIEWVAVRPDTLVNHDDVTEYEIHPSPIRSAIFNPGSTSRVNVAHFMAELITDDNTWNKWKGQMPVIYNAESSGLNTSD